jgi:hypothetical protein
MMVQALMVRAAVQAERAVNRHLAVAGELALEEVLAEELAGAEVDN